MSNFFSRIFAAYIGIWTSGASSAMVCESSVFGGDGEDGEGTGDGGGSGDDGGRRDSGGSEDGDGSPVDSEDGEGERLKLPDEEGNTEVPLMGLKSAGQRKPNAAAATAMIQDDEHGK